MVSLNDYADLPGDSQEYEILSEAAWSTAQLMGLTCEIGLRQGRGSAIILNARATMGRPATHVAIDPYGNLEYSPNDTARVRLDYTNDMKELALANLHLLAAQTHSCIYYFCLTDTAFMARYKDGVPVYDEHVLLVNDYSLVHFDGPHTTRDVQLETEFFADKAVMGAKFVYDDVDSYDHGKVDSWLLKEGWEVSRKGTRKISYRRYR